MTALIVISLVLFIGTTKAQRWIRRKGMHGLQNVLQMKI